VYVTSFFSAVMPRGLSGVPGTVMLLIGVTTEGLLALLATILVLRRYQREQNDSATRDISGVHHGLKDVLEKEQGFKASGELFRGDSVLCRLVNMFVI
jgi:hypothetical protein